MIINKIPQVLSNYPPNSLLSLRDPLYCNFNSCKYTQLIVNN